MVYQTNSAEDTQKIARDLAKKYAKGGIFALFGPLGAGKTTFVQGFGQELGIKERLISPTFTLIREHSLPHHPQGKLYHIDLYRLEQVNKIEELGLTEIFNNPHNIVLIEWAEKIDKLLPAHAVRIKFKTLSESQREIEIKE
ncbi:MAG: tRNA (adenosine(37)-N6)-threonylcarbamoyltransferase complex ATPase subunit type 1 TsaE [Patescibacteria group bacterium]|nr:tRNA (adenosine(37)-N6)-threonylcarbamoyltransferase complex ATPase subunit type 1 TsaE [Patescibacteria group bacterium]